MIPYFFSIIQQVIHRRETINLIINYNDKCMCQLHGNKWKCTLFPSLWDALYQNPNFTPSLQTLLQGFCGFHSISLSPLIIFAYCAQHLYADLIWLDFWLSMPWPPISSTHLTLSQYWDYHNAGQGDRTGSITMAKD